MRNRTSKIENLKNALIVVLVVSAILLLYFLWENDTFNNVKTPIDIFSETQKPELSKPADFVVPENISVNLGTGKYKSGDKMTDAYWREFIGKFKQFSLSENLFVEEIKQEQWDQAAGYTSLKVDFTYEISLTNLCLVFEINQPSAYNTIEIVSSMLYSEGSKESIIIFDEKNRRYYRLAASQNIGLFSDLIKKIEENEEDDYLPMSEPLGASVNNDCLITLEKHTNIQVLSFESEIAAEGDAKVREIAQLFFGENFDFIRRIKETNNTTVYVYGYGEKLLTSSQDGSFEYREEFSGGAAQESFYNSFRICSEYIDKHGGFKAERSQRSQAITPYLQDVHAIEQDKRKGYRFTFGIKIDGLPVCYQTRNAFVIEVIGAQVTYYKRFVIVPEAPDTHAPADSDIMEAAEVLLMNYNDNIKNIFIQNNIDILDKSTKMEEEDMDDFDIIAEKIDAIKIGYLKMDGEGLLLPVWIFTAGEVNMYFDLHSGETLGYTAE